MTNSFDEGCKLFVKPNKESIEIILLSSKNIVLNLIILIITFLFKVINVELCNDEISILDPKVLVVLLNFASN